MSKTNVTTRHLDFLVARINMIYQDRPPMDAQENQSWQRWRDECVRQLHSVYRPSARPHAARIVAELALDELLENYSLWHRLELAESALERYDNQEREMERSLFNHQDRLEVLEQENATLLDEVTQLRAALARQPQTATVTIPGKTIHLRSEIQREIIRLVGKGLGRSWRITDLIITGGLATNANSVRNAIRKLKGRGLLDNYRRHNKVIGWQIATGGTQQLVTLTETGKQWCQQAFGSVAVESEIAVAARRHKSVSHGVGILEARDYLRAAGYLVDDDPAAILARAGDFWGVRSEPDLLVLMDADYWPVEVQREVSERLLNKWRKTLTLAGRLALILFNEKKRAKQEGILRRAMLRYELPDGGRPLDQPGDDEGKRLAMGALGQFTDEWMNREG